MTGLEAFVICFGMVLVFAGVLARAAIFADTRDKEAEAAQMMAANYGAELRLREQAMAEGIIDPDMN